MNLFRRHIGRRVAAVGVGVALLVLGLEGPAFAAAPTITGFTPTSGPAGCVVDITGTAFTDFPVTATYKVEFAPPTGAAVAATDFAVVSATEIWAVVPVLAAGTSYNIKITNPGAPSGVTSTATYLFTVGAGGCAPTIASFAPTCGSSGTTVVTTGTNLLRDDPATGYVAGVAQGSILGGFVRFSPYATDATHTVPDVDTGTSLSVLVSSDAADGPIKATNSADTDPVTAGTQGASVFSTTNFDVPPPDCVPVGPVTHARSVSLSLRKHLVARGKVSSTEDPAFTDCVASVPVKIQRRVSGHWKTVGSTTTSDTGAYKKRIKDKAGKYRAKAPQVSLGTPVTDVCSGAKSPVRKNT